MSPNRTATGLHLSFLFSISDACNLTTGIYSKLISEIINVCDFIEMRIYKAEM